VWPRFVERSPAAAHPYEPRSSGRDGAPHGRFSSARRSGHSFRSLPRADDCARRSPSTRSADARAASSPSRRDRREPPAPPPRGSVRLAARPGSARRAVPALRRRRRLGESALADDGRRQDRSGAEGNRLVTSDSRAQFHLARSQARPAARPSSRLDRAVRSSRLRGRTHERDQRRLCPRPAAGLVAVARRRRGGPCRGSRPGAACCEQPHPSRLDSCWSSGEWRIGRKRIVRHRRPDRKHWRMGAGRHVRGARPPRVRARTEKRKYRGVGGQPDRSLGCRSQPPRARRLLARRRHLVPLAVAHAPGGGCGPSWRLRRGGDQFRCRRRRKSLGGRSVMAGR
jgi:hypothetical protein